MRALRLVTSKHVGAVRSLTDVSGPGLAWTRAAAAGGLGEHGTPKVPAA